MGRKWFDKVLFVLVIVACIVFTWFVGRGALDMMLYNFAFLVLMVIICIVGMVLGFGKMAKLERAFDNAAEEIDNTFNVVDSIESSPASLPEDLFENEELDERYHEFTGFIRKSQSGIGDIEDYINEDEVDSIFGRRLVELIPDVLTSLGILGTFIGLVFGLKNFEPSDYEAMTASVTSLVNGIKVAFLTSIYGLSLSLVFGYGTKAAYSDLMNSLRRFLDKFHHYVIPSAEAEARNIMVNYQSEQTEAIAKMTEQFSEHLANSFEKVITPSFRKMNQSMDVLTETMAKGQEELLSGLLEDFLQKMRSSFQLQFDNFNEALEELTKAQNALAENTKNLYHDMAQELRTTFENESTNMQGMVREMGAMHKEYLTSAQQTIDTNQQYSESLNQNYRQVISYLQEAEQSSAKFWVACNQAMQKYVSAASVSVEGFAAASQHNSNLYEANVKLVESYNERMQEFVQYQKLTAKTMEQVQNLLYNIVTAPESGHRTNIRNMAVNNSNRDLLLDIQKTLQEQGERQEELLETMVAYMKESSRKKGRGIFRGDK
ncbi:pectinesterase inhibitor domain protein [Marvinbryantia formatexigens DSM 14469]|uniref:Pectinesterase inhibitor domain protein n=1 Tax=Marvinbryantia formatexigens DSM 14469 TaxID=478749 RepID=C6LAB8_9FIRM|nr:MotA/TolQ/ExbB proton channel family protein [Marvinbryantia formatexigens]EET62525.1 pectinesterase inhibitor domain protein [Marvinbryantia formatexigens DSM 14469]UWO24950.1 MotA/TolQ/ExbB proton channel family protein [Marvinbryantia formatexigens DSM 14469]SDG25018.1 MotA/TolQ/ExbB proton channel family protein [Marvinbryantia formatexigens]